MSRDKQIEEMAKAVCHLDRTCDECMTSFECKAMMYAKRFYDAGYRKSSEVALEAVDDFQRRLRHIFLDMCNGNDYDALNLLQIDSAIEALYDAFVAELKKKYTEVAERREDIEKSPVDCSTPSVTDSKGEGK